MTVFLWAELAALMVHFLALFVLLLGAWISIQRQLARLNAQMEILLLAHGREIAQPVQFPERRKAPRR